MRDALKATGRPIVFSMCEWGRNQPWTWARGVAHLWRTTGDIQDRWEQLRSRLLDQQVGLEKYAGPGGWNDPDMLEVGNGGMTIAEYRAHFSLWCLLSAPLMAGNDIRSMTPEIREILTNKDVIAVDQDPPQQGRRIRKDGDLEVWAKKLAGNAQAVILFNRGNAPAHDRAVVAGTRPPVRRRARRSGTSGRRRTSAASRGHSSQASRPTTSSW